MLIIKKKNQAFTLVELLLYIVIATTIILSTTTLFFKVLEVRTKDRTILEVEQNGFQIMQIITNNIKTANEINTPNQGNSSSTLSLEMEDSLINPTIFDLSDGTIRVTEGTSSPVALSPSHIIVNNLTFNNYSRNNTPGIIQVQFELTYINPNNQQEFNYTQTFQGSSSIRN
jgi:Tfp pilus assembly protein PilW